MKFGVAAHWQLELGDDTSVMILLAIHYPPGHHDTLSTALPASLPATIKSMYLSRSSKVPLVRMGWKTPISMLNNIGPMHTSRALVLER